MKQFKKALFRNSVSRQITAGIFALVLVIVVAISLISFLTLREMATKLAMETLNTEISILNHDLQTRLNTLGVAASNLAENPLVANALVDDLGRDVYLRDFLNGITDFEGFSVDIDILNFQGDVIASNHTDYELAASSEWFEAIVNNGDGNAALINSSNGPLLLIAEPILFRNTGLPEGALAFHVNLTEWFHGGRSKQALRESPWISLIALKFIDTFSGVNASFENGVESSNLLYVGGPVNLSGSLSSIQLSLGLGADPALTNDPAVALLYRTGMVGAIILSFALLLSVFLAKNLTRKLSRLHQNVSLLSDVRTHDVVFKTDGKDEVDSLAEAFNDLVNDLRKAYIQLEEKSQQELADSESRYRSIVDNVSEGIITIDDKGTIETFNEGAQGIFGYTRDEAIGQNVNLLLPENERHNHDSYVRDSRLHETRILNKVRELFGLRKNGEKFPIEINISVISMSHSKKYVGVLRDISERKANEEKLHRSMQEADKANQAKSDFLSSMSHELRTPLNAILGFAQLLEFNPKEPLTDVQKDSVSHIKKGGDHLLRLINDILDLAKIEAGKVPLSMEHIYPRLIFKECLELLQGTASERDVTLNGKRESEHGIEADYTRLKQILLNLVSNAIKYNKIGGTVTFGCIDKDERTVRIYVTDTGDGIPVDKMSELFKPFSRLGKEASEIEGTGIGLTVAKQLVEIMGGEIGCDSEVGKGSTFWIDFPRAEKSIDLTELDTQGQVIEEPSIGKAASSGKILYVEDNPANLALMEQIFDRVEGISMISAHTAELGMVSARENTPDMIILDINLPGMNGFEALKHFREMEETKTLPIIALSAAATQNDIQKGIDAGFQHYLTKPINVVEVTNIISSLLVSDKT